MPDYALQNHFVVEIEGLGREDGVALMGDLIEVTVESSLHLPDVATIVLHDAALKWVDDRRVEPGKGLKLSAKAEEDDRPIFDGEIVEMEPEYSAATQRLTLRAFDRLHRLTRGHHVRSFQNVTDGDLVQRIAREVRLTAKVGDASQVHPYVFQNNETNLAFLQGRAAALGYLLCAEGSELHFEAAGAEPETIELKWGQTLQEFRPRLTTASQVSGSTVRGWDPATRQAIVGQVQNGNGTPKVGESRRAGQLAQEAFRIEAPLLTADRPIRTQAAADTLAQAMADRRASRFIEAEGVCSGNSKLVAGTSVRLDNIGTRFNGTYYVTSARHVYTGEAGYTTHFSITGQNPSTLLALLTPEPSATSARGLVIGIVTDNQDPDGQGRVKVKYPWLSPDHASDWARVVVPGGGGGRGMQFLPEVNDEVLVGFELGDVHYPYVLGGLWNGRDKPPGDQGTVVSGGKVQQRLIRSRSGHTITLDDSDGSPGITIEDKNGNVVFLDSSANALKIKAKGDVSIEAQGNMSLKATGSVEVKGMGVKVNGGGGTVDVKGSIINLN